MPRKPNSFLLCLIIVAGALPLYHNDCLARPADFPIKIPYGDVIDSGKASDTADNMPTIAPEEPIFMTGDSAITDTVIFEPVLYVPGTDTLLINLYHSRDTSGGTIGSPTLNLFKSVVFPGWGQYCNRKYIKAGIIFAAESYFIYKAVENGRQASDWHTRWRAAPTELKSVYFMEYTGYRDRRNTFLWYTALTVFLSMFDAYVDAHLQNFPKNSSANLSVEAVSGDEPLLTLRYTF